MMPHMRSSFGHRLVDAWSAHAAEVGRVGIVVALWTSFVVAAAEWFRPGIVGTVLPLEASLGATACFAVIALAAPAGERRRSVVMTVIVAALFAYAASWIAWTAFVPVADLRPWAASAAACAVFALIVSARHPERPNSP